MKTEDSKGTNCICYTKMDWGSAFRMPQTWFITGINLHRNNTELLNYVTNPNTKHYLYQKSYKAVN